MPPLCSIVRMARVDSRMRTGRAEDVGQQRRVLQVGQEAAAGPVVGVADVVAGQHALAGDLAAAGHRGRPRSGRKRRVMAKRQGASSVPPARRQAGALPLTHQRALPSGLPPRAQPLEPFTFGWIAKAPPLLGVLGAKPPGGLQARIPLQVFRRPDHRPPHMRDRAVVEAEALFRLAEVAADHVGELLQLDMHVRDRTNRCRAP